LLTFYSDLWLANKLNQLHSVGDLFYFSHGTPNSWADGNYVLLGQDSIDFDFTLDDANAEAIVTILVRHVRPAISQIRLPAEWMKAPVSDTANNGWKSRKAATVNFQRKSARRHATFVSESPKMERFYPRQWKIRLRFWPEPVLTPSYGTAEIRYATKLNDKLNWF
jgi:hypothetical protein